VTLPGLLGVVDRLGRRAVGAALDNAQAATAALAEQVRLREQLAPADDDEPGALARLDRATCLVLLASRRTGRLAYVARAGVPDVVPVNLALDGDRLLVRSGPGPKLQAAERREVIAVEVDDIDEQRRTGWSVVVAGRACRLHTSEVARLPADLLPEVWARGPRSSVIAIELTRVEGRRLR
jgi:nitroimidazol reductase NimA-like FMN-containing flavoprotein (pyridoxamine 5'-phosphate oxidase superfamily)